MKRKNFIKIVLVILIIGMSLLAFSGCSNNTTSTKQDVQQTLAVADKLAKNQPTPNDINYSLERYNLIRRTYWVNGQREKANTLVCEIEKPLGYIALFLENGSCAGKFVVDGKVSSLNSFLTPDSEYFEKYTGSSDSSDLSSVEKYSNKWIADVDGSYGENDTGIFFFTTDGKYIEWTGTYLYSDIPFDVKDVVINYKEVQ